MSASFTRPFDVARIGRAGRTEMVQADKDELPVLAEIMQLPAIHSFQASFDLAPWKKGGLHLKGSFSAEIEQVCVISLDTFKSRITGEFERYFTHDPVQARQIIDLDQLADDVPDQIENGRIDLAAIASEALALSLDPHPRKPGVRFSPHIELPEDPQEAKGHENPFAILQQLKKH